MGLRTALGRPPYRTGERFRRPAGDDADVRMRWQGERGAAALAAAALALVLGVSAPKALACSCALPVPSPQTLAGAEAVFAGTVVARSDPRAGEPVQSSGDPIAYTLSVDTRFKGDLGDTADVATARFGATCGVEMAVGQRYLIVAHRSEEGPYADAAALSTGLCSGTRALPAGAPLPDFLEALQRPSAAAWRVPERLSLPATGVGSPQVALSPSGAASAVWNRLTHEPGGETIRSARVLAAARPGGGAGFGPPEVISGEGEVAFDPQVAAAGRATSPSGSRQRVLPVGSRSWRGPGRRAARGGRPKSWPPFRSVPRPRSRARHARPPTSPGWPSWPGATATSGCGRPLARRPGTGSPR